VSRACRIVFLNLDAKANRLKPVVLTLRIEIKIAADRKTLGKATLTSHEKPPTMMGRTSEQRLLFLGMVGLG